MQNNVYELVCDMNQKQEVLEERIVALEDRLNSIHEHLEALPDMLAKVIQLAMTSNRTTAPDQPDQTRHTYLHPSDATRPTWSQSSLTAVSPTGNITRNAYLVPANTPSQPGSLDTWNKHRWQVLKRGTFLPVKHMHRYLSTDWMCLQNLISSSLRSHVPVFSHLISHRISLCPLLWDKEQSNNSLLSLSIRYTLMLTDPLDGHHSIQGVRWIEQTWKNRWMMFYCKKTRPSAKMRSWCESLTYRSEDRTVTQTHRRLLTRIVVHKSLLDLYLIR